MEESEERCDFDALAAMLDEDSDIENMSELEHNDSVNVPLSGN